MRGNKNRIKIKFFINGDVSDQLLSYEMKRGSQGLHSVEIADTKCMGYDQEKTDNCGLQLQSQ